MKLQFYPHGSIPIPQYPFQIHNQYFIPIKQKKYFLIKIQQLAVDSKSKT